VAPEKNRFRFKLEGYDRDWQDVGNRRQAFYTNLPPRNYRFRVIACNNSGVWNEAGASLEFSVLPAFYQTNWFRALCVVGFLALVWGMYQLRVQKMQRQFNAALEKERLYAGLKTRDAKIQRLVEANIIGIFVIDFGGQILQANDAFLRMVGYERDDLLSGRMSWTDLTPAEWHDADAQRLETLNKTGSLQPFEKEYFRKDGTRVPVLVGVARFEEEGNQAVVFALDLTVHKKAEQKFRDLLELAPDALVVMNRQGRIILVNTQMEKVFGYQREELLGKEIDSLVPEQFQGRHAGHRAAFSYSLVCDLWVRV
jgi:PAS domain S-box-containing protein